MMSNNKETSNFFKRKKEYVTIEELSKLVNISNILSLDKDKKIYNLKALSDATEVDAAFLHNDKYISQLETTKAGFCFVKQSHEKNVLSNGKTIPLVVDNPHYAYTVLLDELFSVPLFEVNAGVSSKASVAKSVKIGNNVEIQAGAVIFDNVTIGDNCKICANAVINHNCIIGNNNYIGANSTVSYAIIGNNNIIQNNVSLGHCGYGFAHDKGFNFKVPQLGIVRIGNHVEIGSGCSVARGALKDTIISDMVKLDCLVHIAHGVTVGAGCFLAAQTGVAGSAEIGMFCQMGGQTGINGHIKVGNFNVINAKSGIVKSTADKAQLAGFPAVDTKEWRKQMVVLKRLAKKKGGLDNDEY